MLAKSSMASFVFAVGLALYISGMPSEANAVVGTRHVLSRTDNVDPVSYYETMYRKYYKNQKGRSEGAETVQDQNFLQQLDSDVEIHQVSEHVQKGNIYKGASSQSTSFGSKTIRTHSTVQLLNSTGKIYDASRTVQEGNIYLFQD